MIHLPMLDNILAQPQSHRALLHHHGVEARETLKACADLTRRASGRIIFTGMGASLFAALPAVSYFEQQGRPAQAIESSELLHHASSTLRSGDVGILISRSGESVEVLRLAEKMRAAGMTLIGVTNLPDTNLEKIADITLRIGSLADQLIAIQTYTGTVLTLLLLAEEAFTSDGNKFNEASLAALPALSAYIRECFDASESWQGLFHDGIEGGGIEGGGIAGGGGSVERDSSVLYLLGRGPALASVYEGALLLHETAKVAAVGMSSGQFRHGPVEAVSSQFRAVVFGSPATTRVIDRALADDLCRMGAKVRWIGPFTSPDLSPSNSGSHAPALTTWPAIPALLAPIFEIVPLQLAAYRLALWRGINAGDFRFASEVTSAESGFPLFESLQHESSHPSHQGR